MSKQAAAITRVIVGTAPFCGRCRNPFGVVQNGGPIEVGPPARKFGQRKPGPRQRALCPGIAAGKHIAWKWSIA